MPEAPEPPSIARRAASSAFWAFVGLSSILLFPVALVIWAVTAPFDRRRVALHRFTCFWASLYTWTNPLWDITVEGRDRIDRDTTYVMVANHLSLLDILVLFRLFRHFKWVSKVENFSVPFVGWNMRLNGYIPLKRGNAKSARKMLAACERTIGEGSSVLIFPEGTRSRSGRLQTFKPGAFELAVRTGVPILPIVVEGTRDALPRRGFVLQGRHAIRLTVLEAIPPQDMVDKDARQLAREVRARIAEQLPTESDGGTEG